MCSRKTIAIKKQSQASKIIYSGLEEQANFGKFLSIIFITIVYASHLLYCPLGTPMILTLFLLNYSHSSLVCCSFIRLFSTFCCFLTVNEDRLHFETPQFFAQLLLLHFRASADFSYHLSCF